MKKLTALFLTLVMLFTLMPAAFADIGPDDVWPMTYYIDSINGDDSNDGLTPDTAFATLNRAFQMKFHPGFNILFRRGGTYCGGLDSNAASITSFGTAEYPITLGAYGEGANPVIRTDEQEPILVVSGSHVHVRDLDFTSPKGYGVHFLALGETDLEGIVMENCRIYNIMNKRLLTSNNNYCALTVSGNWLYKVHDCVFRNIEIFDCAYGIHASGSTYEFDNEHFVSPEESYCYNNLFDGIYMHHVWCQGLELCAQLNTTVRNSRLIDVSLNVPFAVAPIWTHHCKNCMIEYCEIAGATNIIDGMAVDFDGWSENCTYRYIYSHDNNRFMRNCLYDGATKNSGCTVDHCLSVSDDGFINNASLTLMNLNTLKLVYKNPPIYTDHFTFTNNIIMDASPFYFGTLRHADISGNYFGGNSLITAAVSSAFTLASITCGGTVKNNSYYHFTPLIGSGTKLLLKPMSFEQAYTQLFPNGVHT